MDNFLDESVSIESIAKSIKTLVSSFSSNNPFDQAIHSLANLAPQYLKQLVDNNPYGFLVIDAVGHVVYSNPALKAILHGNFPENYLISKDPNFLTNNVLSTFCQYIQSSDNYYVADISYNPSKIIPEAPNQNLWLEIALTAIKNNEKQLHYYLLYIRDITDHKKMENALHEQNRALIQAHKELQLAHDKLKNAYTELQITHQELQDAHKELAQYRTKLEDKVLERTSLLNKKNQDLQYYSVASMIASTFLSSDTFDQKVYNAFRSLGESLNSQFIFIGQFQKEKIAGDTSNGNPLIMKWKWLASNYKSNMDQFLIELHEQHYNPLHQLKPENIYLQLNLENIPPQIAELFIRYNIKTILTTPIVVGENIYGVLMAGYSDLIDLGTREISMYLNGAIIIGLALKNQYTYRNMQDLYESLNTTSVALFIANTNEQGIPKFVYVSDFFCKISKKSRNELISASSMGVLFQDEDLIKIATLYQHRLKGYEIPNLYDVQFVIDGVLKYYRISITPGLYNGKIAIYGFVIPKEYDFIPTIDEIYNNLISSPIPYSILGKNPPKE